MVDIDRRQLLQGGGLAFMLMALGRADGLIGPPPAAIAATTPLLASRQTGTSGIYTPPYSVTGSCVLSEDYFLTSAVVLDDPTQDRIVPFTNSTNGAVEALVLSGASSLSYLARDPSAVSGWSYTTLWTVTDGSLTDVAVITDGSGTTYAMVLQTETTNNNSFHVPVTQRRPHWALLDSGGSWNWMDGPDTIPVNSTPLRAGLDQSQPPKPYFYTVTTENEDGLQPSTVLFWQPQPDNYRAATASSSLAGEDIVDAFLTWDSNSPPQGGILALSSTSQVAWYPQGSDTGDTNPADYSKDNATGLGPGTLLLWNSLDCISQAGPLQPAEYVSLYVYYDSGGEMLYLNPQQFDTDAGPDPSGATAVSQAGLPPIQTATVWAPPWTNYSIAVRDDTGVVSIVNGTGLTASPFSPPIPIAGGLSSAVGLPTDASESTLFVVDEAATLNVLSRDPASLAWSSTPVHQASPSVAQLTTWRVQLTVNDANGVPVAGTQVSITPDQTIGIWQGTGNSILSPSVPLTTNTDAMGRITFAYPASELSTASLSVQVMVDGAPSGGPVTVNPDGEVHAFLAGTGSLTGIGSLSGSVLSSATNSSGQPLLPNLSALSGGAQQNAAAAVSTAMGRCMSAGLGAAPASGDPTQWSLDLTGGQPSYSDLSAASVRASLSASSWWDEAKKDLESALHAVEHGLITVTNVTLAWVQDTADSAYHWVVNLAVTLVNGAADAMSYVISDVRSAVAAIGGIVKALGGDIVDFIAWLRMEIAGFFTAVETNAKTICTLLDQGASRLTAELTEVKTLLDNAFASFESEVTADLNDVAAKLEGQSISTWLNRIDGMSGTGDTQGGSGSGAPPPANTSSPEMTALQDALQPILTDIHYMWMLDKILNFIEGEFSLTSYSAVNDPLAKLISSVECNAQSLVTSMGNLFHNVEQQCPQVGDLYTLPFTTLIGWINDFVHDLLVFADQVIDDLLSLATAVATGLQDDVFGQDTTELIPLVGGILTRFFGVHDTVTVAKLFSYIAAFPATLYNEHANPNQPLFPPLSGTATDAAVNDSIDWRGPIATVSAVIQVIWAFWDVAVDASAMEPNDASSDDVFLTVGDCMLNAMLQCVQWPGAANQDGTQPAPFTSDPPMSGPMDKLTFASWMLGWSDTILCAAIEVSDGESDLATWWFTALLSAIGFGNLIISVVWALSTGASNYVLANVIASYIPDSTEILITQYINAETEGESMLVKLLLDLACNLAAGITDIPAYGSGSTSVVRR